LKESKLRDSDLIERYIETQSPECFSEIYNRYSSKVYGKCLSILKDGAMAEDAVQEIFMKIFLRLTTFKQGSTFSTWVYAVTYNYCIDYIRKKKRQPITDENDIAEKNLADLDLREFEVLEEEFERMKVAMDNLHFEDREVLLMKYKEGMQIDEIAEIINKSESAVKMKILRAKQKVRDFIQANYVSMLLVVFGLIYLLLWMKK
jgi:RNA polymerase sigma factor (sigma-70 family)